MHLALLLTTLAAAAPEAAVRPDEALAAYVARPDDAFAWSVRRAGRLGSAQYAELRLVSQRWRGGLWKHQLFCLRPANLNPAARTALLFVAGGSWKASLDEPPADDDLPDEALLFAQLAERIQTPVAILMQVPFQPLFGGRYEDQIIAYTFDEFLKTGDTEWPLLLPMVKSAVRGMDAVQQFCRRRWSLEIEAFTVTGASKRGWTTWLTGAVDRRAAALAPMVIDVLNMDKQMEHQEEVWGGPSYKIHDYTERNLHRKFRTPRGRELLQIVDPYRYRERLTQPKLLIIGTNDHYWPLDALNVYWSDLPSPKYVLYVPNNRHGLKDLQRVTGGLAALHRSVAFREPLPRLQWRFEPTPEGVRLRLRSQPPPKRAQAWRASAAQRDFRASSWRDEPMTRQDDWRTYELKRPASGFAALFGEAVFDGPAGEYFLSTNVRLLGGAGSPSAAGR